MATIQYRLSVELYDSDQGTAPVFSASSGLRTITTGSSLYHSTTQTVGTSGEALTLGETSGIGLVVVENLEQAGGNYVELRLPGTGAGNDSIRVDPGEMQMFRLGSDASAPHAIANTAPVSIRWTILPIT